MIISVNGREKKIAILDNGRVTEFYIERGEENTGIAGNIYKGRVQRVLPGMQSAFVNIGLERDAFLYVSDFFDEEEEIERIVMEKSKKISPEEARREANEKIERQRVEREKQMEGVQEIAEPLVEGAPAPSAAPDDEKGKGKRGRGRRGRTDREERTAIAPATDDDTDEPRVPIFEYEDFGFERIIDDEADTGEMFKDAMIQERIVDQVRAVEFDMESFSEATVGSLLGEVGGGSGGFERIADDDEVSDSEEPKKKRKVPTKAGHGKFSKTSKKKKTDGEDVEPEEPKELKKKATAATKAKTTKAKPKTTRSKSAKTAEADATGLEDSEASVKEPRETAEMAVRRGGRGRRRGGRGRRGAGAAGEGGEFTNGDEGAVEDVAELEAPEPVEEKEAAPDTSEAVEKKEPKDARGKREGRDGRDGRDGRGGGRGGERRDTRERGRNGRERGPQPTISELLREGQEILVQIAKEPIARKGARITSHIALPGRFLVYMPTIEHLGVSRKIESSNERGRLRTLIQRIRQDEEIPSGGFIVRTAGIGISEEDLRQDAKYLVRTWQDIKKSSEKSKSPAMVHQDLDLVQRLLRDQMSDDFAAIRVDSEEEYLRTVEFINRMQPKLVNRVKLYTREEPILDAYGVQEEIEKALRPRVWLKSGGYLVINQTEALVAIDVNTGKFVGKGNARLEDTITKTNMEAVDEIARQIRLRDLGGIIVLDLIDMEDRKNRHKVYQALQDALHSDKSPTKVLSFNDFGLIIMTRKRVKQSLERTMCAPCEYCEGAGWVKSPQTVCYEILTEARRVSKQLDDVRQTTLRVHPDVARALRSTERSVLEEIEAHLGNVDLASDPTVHQAQFDFAFV